MSETFYNKFFRLAQNEYKINTHGSVNFGAFFNICSKNLALAE